MLSEVRPGAEGHSTHIPPCSLIVHVDVHIEQCWAKSATFIPLS